MKLLFIKSLWGMEGTLPQQLDQIAGAGYDGVECPIPGSSSAVAELRREVEARGLTYVAQCFHNTPENLLPDLERAAESGAVRVALQGGLDRASWDEGCRFLEACLKGKAATGTRLTVETHRGYLFFNPWQTAAYLRQFPEIEITADFSHWVNVCEGSLPRCTEDIALAITRAAHIHARVGYEHGPQVPDPAAPEYQYQVERHIGWWQGMVKANKDRGEEFLTVDPEFGPAGYLHTLPHTNVPVANLWQICLNFTARLRKELTI
ncbi:MAG: sugar phosphate isomerase/epimerase family protein [Candidatus Methylacidiphilales bacterium]|nr:hypothetical protein [Candidatus Methylacidiphilales bacterium]